MTDADLENDIEFELALREICKIYIGNLRVCSTQVHKTVEKLELQGLKDELLARNLGIIAKRKKLGKKRKISG